MKRLLMVGLLVLVFISTYLIMLPATWMDAVLQRASQDSLALTGATGTLWNGEGSLQALLPTGEAITLVPVSWNIDPAELMALKVHIKAQSSRDNKPVLNATLGPGEAFVQEAKLDLPAALLGVLSPTLRAAALSGRISLHVDELRFGSSHAAGKAQAYWNGAGSSLSRIRPLGNYLLDLNGKGSGMDMRLSTIGGPLTLTGSGSWIPGRRPDIRVMATPDEGARQELAPLLRMMGHEASPGTYTITLDPSVGVVSR